MPKIINTVIHLDRAELDLLVENLILLQNYVRPDGQDIALYGLDFPSICTVYEQTQEVVEVDIPVEIQQESEVADAGSEGQPTEETETA